MVKLEWGHKRTCQGCGARFYDMQKSPIVCPKCGSVFEILASTRGRRGKAAEAAKKSALIENVELIDDIGLVDDLVDDLGDTGLIDDGADLGEDLDDIPEIDKDDDL